MRVRGPRGAATGRALEPHVGNIACQAEARSETGSPQAVIAGSDPGVMGGPWRRDRYVRL